MITFKEVSKKYHDFYAVKNVSFEIADHEFLCVIGGSGSGKTTLLRLINRMEDISAGDICINGRNIMDCNPVDLRRHIGYAIQNTGLLPHFTIYQNLTTVPMLLKWEKQRCDAIAHELIIKAGMEETDLKKYPSELSGGQQQRVGVMRAVAASPGILLMDEPFGALDPITRASLQSFILEIKKQLDITVIFVTHDIEEAFKLGDRLLILNHGEIEQLAGPDEILKHPAGEYVKGLIQYRKS